MLRTIHALCLGVCVCVCMSDCVGVYMVLLHVRQPCRGRFNAASIVSSESASRVAEATYCTV